jgi:hypothetical protein
MPSPSERWSRVLYLNSVAWKTQARKLVPFIKVIGCEEVWGRSFHSIILNQRISIARKVSSLRTMLPKELIGTFFYKELLGTLR